MKSSIFKVLTGTAKGFSLTEVMVGGAILAGVGLTGAKLFNDQKMAQKKIQDEAKLTNFHQSLQKQLNTSGICNATFRDYFKQPIPSGEAITRIYGCQSGCKETGSLHNASNVTRTAAPLYSKGEFINNENVWILSGINHLPRTVQASEKVVPEIFRISYTKNPRLTGGKSVVINKDVTVNLRYYAAGGGFYECLDKQDSSVNNLQKEICESLSGGFKTDGAAANAAAVWNEETQTCNRVQKDCASLGMAMDGIDSTGQVRCKPIVAPGQMNGMEGNSQSCPPGQRPQVQFISGKFNIICTP